jgi:hypothetical protein
MSIICGIFTYNQSNMSEQTNYIAEQDYNRFERIINTQDYLTQEEYDFCFAYDKNIREYTTYVGYYYGCSVYLNLRLYSEHNHEKRQSDMETY